MTEHCLDTGQYEQLVVSFDLRRRDSAQAKGVARSNVQYI